MTFPAAGRADRLRAAVAKRASPEARAAGATACRSILTVLEAKPGQSLASNAQPAGRGSDDPDRRIVAMLSARQDVRFSESCCSKTAASEGPVG